MPTANNAIQRILKEKNAGIRGGMESMTAILKELQKQVQAELGRAALGSWDAYQLKRMLNTIERHIADATLKGKARISGLMDKSWGLGGELVTGPMSASGIYSGFNVSKSSLDKMALKDFAEHITENAFKDSWTKIKSELTLGVLGGKTPEEVAKAIGMNLDDPSIFTSIRARAEAITKTEMGRTFSLASQARMEEAADQVEGLEKQWVHAGHPKAGRPFHQALHGHHIPVNEPFLVGSVQMMYPRDVKAPLSEIINCGCDHIPYHKSWGVELKPLEKN